MRPSLTYNYLSSEMSLSPVSSCETLAEHPGLTPCSQSVRPFVVIELRNDPQVEYDFQIDNSSTGESLGVRQIQIFIPTSLLTAECSDQVSPPLKSLGFLICGRTITWHSCSGQWWWNQTSLQSLSSAFLLTALSFLKLLFQNLALFNFYHVPNPKPI